MPFPITGPLSKDEFRSGIIDHYWKDLPGAIGKSPFKCAHPAELPDDYAKIGAFLSDKAAVESALLELEKKIRTNPALTQLPKSHSSVAPFTIPANKTDGSAAHLKSHKMLTDALRESEAQNGFNHEQIINGTFHDDAKNAAGRLHSSAALSDKQGNLQSIGKDKPDDKLSKSIQLPRGAPTVIGDLDPLAFNVLLRHGYQFKDVAAGAYHGEYTHRLQWFAIVNGALGLTNPALDIFKSLGYLFAKADKNVPADGRQLWMWQALFDTAESEGDAKRLKTIAYATNGAVFTCPESMNKSLMTFAMTDTYDNAPLWCLRVLLKTRWKKRFDETLPPTSNGPVKAVGMEKLLQNKLPNDRTRMVLASDSKTHVLPTGNRIKKTREVDKKVYNEATKQFEMKRVNESYFENEMETKVETITKLGTGGGYALAWYLRNDQVS